MVAQISDGVAQGNYMLGRNPERYDVPDTTELEQVQRWLLRLSIEHLHGPEQIEYSQDELVVLCLMRNGQQYVESFIEHYRSLGAKHLVFLDNGSTDGTVEALMGYEGVTVLRTNVLYKRYLILMKRYLIERFGRGRWTLSVDIDELFDYPYSDVLGLREFLGYLNEQEYTAVVSHMLDLFPEKPLSEAAAPGEGSLKETNRFYEVSHVKARDYQLVGDIGNKISNEDIRFYNGGVQQRVFGIGPLLSKHPLVFLDEQLRPMDLSDHWVGNAHVADLTGVLLHYKLNGGLYQLVQREMEERRYVSRHGKYDKYQEVLENNPKLQIKRPLSLELESVNDLVGNGFLSVSADYLKLVQQRNPEKLVEQAKELTQTLNSTKRRVQQLQARVSERDQQITSLEQQVEELGAEVERRGSQAESLRRQLDGITSSKSWRFLDGINGVRKKILVRLVKK